MPRQLRIDFPGAIHHVMSRGDRRENIYLGAVDRQDFLKTLAEAKPIHRGVVSGKPGISRANAGAIGAKRRGESQHGGSSGKCRGQMHQSVARLLLMGVSNLVDVKMR